MVEIPADMTARDLCQLLVYKSHCVDDNSWALVEHHPLLGLGKGSNTVHIHTGAHMNAHTHLNRPTHILTCLHKNPRAFGWAETCITFTDIHRCIHMYACMRARILGQTGSSSTYSHAGMYSNMSECVYYTAYAHTET